MNATHIPPYALVAVIEADRSAALVEDQHHDYRAYLCSMADHGCECIALDFEAWEQVAR